MQRIKKILMWEVLPAIALNGGETNSQRSDYTVKPVLRGYSEKAKKKIGFQDRLLLNADQKYCRMLQREHSAILSIFIKLSFTIKTFVLSIIK